MYKWPIVIIHLQWLQSAHFLLWLCLSFKWSLAVVLNTHSALCIYLVIRWLTSTFLAQFWSGCSWAMHSQSSVKKASSSFYRRLPSYCRLKRKSCIQWWASKGNSDLKVGPLQKINMLIPAKMSLSSYCKKIACQNKTSSIIEWKGEKKTTLWCVKGYPYICFQAAEHGHFLVHVGQKTTHRITRESI